MKLNPGAGKQEAPAATGGGEQARPRRRRRRGTYIRPQGVRHLLTGYDLSTDRPYEHAQVSKGRTVFSAFCPSLGRAWVWIAIALHNFSPYLSPKNGARSGEGAAANNVVALLPR